LARRGGDPARIAAVRRARGVLGPLAKGQPMQKTDSIHGLLDPKNAGLVLVDFQPQMTFAAQSINGQTLVNNAVGLARSAQIFGLPTVLTTCAAESFAGPTYTQLTDVLPDARPIDRTTMNFWEDPAVRRVIEATDRRKWLLAGLWTTACIAFPAIQMLQAGYEVYVVADACGDVSGAAHDLAIQRMIQAGAVPMTWIQVALELQRDWARQDTYEAMMHLMMDHGGSYGVGIQYARKMLGTHAHEGR
jgi:nicotinamidase-related amidase